MLNGPPRDHLFISYAWEDGALAEWLTLKLTAEGYKVWCDRFKLLGGESYPRDIDQAIREQTFRILALLSKHSIAKPNPLKERTLALSLARKRKEDFLIPINVDGLAPDELGWMLSDLSYIPFSRSWAQGLAHLLKKLRSIDAPTPLADGRRVVADWFAGRDGVSDVPERLWTNLIEIEDLPSTLLRITVADPPASDAVATWPHYRESDTVAWSFEAPEDSRVLDLVELEEVDWRAPYGASGLRLADVVTRLLSQYLHFHCVGKGMAVTADGEHLYFPSGVLPGDRLSFTGYEGKATWLLAVGERTFRVGNSAREKSRYHLSPTLRPNLWKYARPVVQVQVRVFLTDLSGRPLDTAKAIRRRKRICKNWWNHQWLSRVLAIASWMADAQERINLARISAHPIVLAGIPLQVTAPVGIDESVFGRAEADEEAELTDEPDDGDDEDDDPRDEPSA